MSTFCDVGGGFFFCPSLPLVCGHQEWGWRGRSTPFEDDHRRRRNPLSTPAALWMVCVLSLPHDPHQKMQPLGQGSETTASPKPFREAPGSEEGERSESLFRFRENPRELKIKPIFISIRLSWRFVFCDFFFLFISVNNVVTIIQFFDIYILLNSYDVEIDIIRSCWREVPNC